MPQYRIYFLNHAGQISRPAEIVDCADDAEATKRARQLVEENDVELWQGGRLVELFPKRVRVPR